MLQRGMSAPFLIALGGLPGVGKTTIGRELARETGAVFLRIDTIEAALRGALPVGDDVGAAGYRIAAALASDTLGLGRCVVADAVNPIALTRALWRDTAGAAGARLVEVEVACSDRAEHRRRVETRRADIDGHRLPSWETVERRLWEPWPSADLVIDTARDTPPAAVAAIRALLVDGVPA
jgi:predicted kinase